MSFLFVNRIQNESDINMLFLSVKFADSKTNSFLNLGCSPPDMLSKIQNFKTKFVRSTCVQTNYVKRDYLKCLYLPPLDI